MSWRSTPEMLPVLKEAGVVDSGGQGLVEVLKGAFDAYLGKEVDYTHSRKLPRQSAASEDQRRRQRQISSSVTVPSLLLYLDKPVPDEGRT